MSLWYFFPILFFVAHKTKYLLVFFLPTFDNQKLSFYRLLMMLDIPEDFLRIEIHIYILMHKHLSIEYFFHESTFIIFPIHKCVMKANICIKYRKHGNSSFSHTFNTFLGCPKSCQMAAHNSKIYIAILFSWFYIKSI